MKRKVNKHHPKKNKMEKHEGRGINTGSQVDRQVGGRRDAWCQVPGATAMAQFCLIILIIFYAAYICALALRCSCIAIKMLRPATETDEGHTGKTRGNGTAVGMSFIECPKSLERLRLGE